MSQEAYTSSPGNFQAIYIGNSQAIAVGGSSVASSSIQEISTIVRLYTNTDCFVAIGQNPVATASSLFLPAGSTEYFAANSFDKVAVLQAAAAGTLYITEGK
jgi:hypothetical protein